MSTLFKMLTGTFQSIAGEQFFLWASVTILDFLNQQEKFVTSATCVTELTLLAQAAFIHKILCFEVIKIFFGQINNGWQDAKK